MSIVSRSRLGRLLLVTGTLAGLATGSAAGQEMTLAARGPRFLVAAPERAAPVEVDARSSALLRRRVSLDARRGTLGGVLKTISEQTGIKFLYNPDSVPVGRSVSLRADSITVAGALLEILIDTNLDVLLSSGTQVALVQREVPLVRVENGAIVGRVIDAKTQTALAGATVVVQGTSRSATTGNDGRYRIAELASGTYTLRARYIGYSPGSATVTVTQGQGATADFTLERSAQRLEEVVTTGTVVPTEVKALPTPINVITAEDIERYHIRRLDEAIRLAVPGAIVWEQGSNDPSLSDVSLRGTSGFGATGSNPKLYIDGVEVTAANQSPIDPQSVERIEVLRGPQAAAIYGSDAMGGVIQVFTKRGDGALRRPEVELSAALGRIESNFQRSGALRQDYSAALRGQNGPASYRVGGGYSRTGDWLPYYSNSSPSAYGGLRVDHGPLTFDLSARYYQQSTDLGVDPRLHAAWPAVFSDVPAYAPFKDREETYSARIEYRLASWWQHSVTAGVDRFSQDYVQTRPRLTTPDDTLLGLSSANARKLSLAYHSTVTGRPTPGLVASITAGVDHWAYTLNSVSGTAPAVTGTVNIVPGTLFMVRRYTTNTGLFVQGQLDLWETLFLTGAVRGEWNSDFGNAIGVPISPRIGATYVRQIGATTLKIRTGYGEAIRPPASGSKDGSVAPFIVIQPNPSIKPERQIGPDMGLDLVFGRHGSLSATYYRQTAEDLLQLVFLNATSFPLISQWQNLARVRNIGWEFEGTVRLGSAVALTGQYAIVRSEAEDLGRLYTGDAQVGKQLIGVPRRTGAATLAITPLRHTSVTAALAYTGARQQYDLLAYYACLGGTGPCSGFAQRNYLVDYSAIATVNLSIEREFLSTVTAYVGVENVANSGSRGRASVGTYAAVPGRITTIGARVRY